MRRPNAEAPTSPSRDWWVAVGLMVSAASAAVSSFGGLRSLALAAGWTFWMAPLLPATVDAFAATASRIWLAGSSTSRRARRFARRCAIGAIGLSLVGNAVWHLIAAGVMDVSWIVVPAVGAVPPVVLGLVSHLAVLRTQSDPAVPEDGPSTAGPPAGGTRYASEDELLEAARQAAVTFSKAHSKPITRDALRATLHIGGHRATTLLRQLRRESSQEPAPLAGGAESTTRSKKA